jgi:hypothetical protein
MGLFRLLTNVATLPIKVATIPVRAVEKAFDEREQPLSDAVADAVSELEDLVDDLEGQP